MESQSVLRVKIKTRLEGELEAGELENVLERVISAFYGLFERKRKAKQYVKLYVRLEPGCTDVTFRADTKEATFKQASEENWAKILNVLSEHKEIPPHKRISETEYEILKQFAGIRKGIRTKVPVSIKGGDNGIEVTLEEEWANKILDLPLIREKEKMVTTWGKLLEGDFRDRDKFTCKLVTLEGKEFNCTYAPEIEEIIANHLIPLNRDVVIKGIEKKLRKRAEIEIKEITHQNELFKEGITQPISEETPRFLGIWEGIKKPADELAKEIIEAAWGEG